MCAVISIGLFAANAFCAETEPALLTDVASLRALSPTEAERRVPVRIRGVVTYYDAGPALCFVQDATGGTYFSRNWKAEGVETPWAPTQRIEPGTMVEIEGLSCSGRFAPFVDNPDGGYITMRLLGSAPFPEPLRPMRGQVLDPKFHSQWVELDAYIGDVEKNGNRLVMKLVVGGRRFDAFLPGNWNERKLPTNLAGSDVRVQGVFGSIFDDQRQLVGMRLLVPSLKFVKLLDPGMNRAFGQTPRAVSELMQFNPGFAERARTEGIVLALVKGEGFYMRGQGGALWVQTRLAERFLPGQRVDVVGFPEPTPHRTVLLDAVVRPNGGVVPLEPLPARAEQLVADRYDGELVRVEARLVNQLGKSGERVFLLQSDRTTFYARSLPGPEQIWPDIQPNSWVELTGICALEIAGATVNPAHEQLPIWRNATQAGIRTATFSLLLRDPGAIRVLQAPPWWTPSRLAAIIGGLAAAVLAVLTWNFQLRRKVELQTALVERRLEKEKIAEERSRIARELHDTLEQHLAGIHLQAQNAARRLHNSPEKLRQSLDTLCALVRHSQDEARRSVWDLRTGTGAEQDFATELREVVSRVQAPDGTRIEVIIKSELAPLKATARHHLLRIAQEAVTNALKHSGASLIRVVAVREDGRVSLQVSDNGIGFDRARQNGSLIGHFGLKGMRERTAKIGATLTIDSAPGSGTTISVILPISSMHYNG